MDSTIDKIKKTKMIYDGKVYKLYSFSVFKDSLMERLKLKYYSKVEKKSFFRSVAQ